MLEIKNLKAGIDGKEILHGLDLKIGMGEVHAIMGPNGSGKSTLSYVLAGREGYEVTGGRIVYEGEDLTDMDPEVRAAKGVFLAFQYPVEIPGVANTTFLKEAVNARRRFHGEDELDAMQFMKELRAKTKELGMSDEMLKRAVNHGFSGGEKKRHEILQMELLQPKFAVLDETDSGLDVDALRVVSEGVNRVHENTGLGVMLITHYTRILNYIKPDFVHVFVEGKVAEQGGPELADQLEAEGYVRFTGKQEAAAIG